MDHIQINIVIVQILGIVILVIYVAALVYITLYCLLQFHLLFYYKRNHWRKDLPSDKSMKIDDNTPFVTIQLPIFNELYVAERLIDNIVQLDYPKDKFEIHVLDDSTDETVDISRKKVEEYRAKGFNIELFTRTDRTGYKAGALKAATPKAKGEFIAIFDADFLPKKDFLIKTLDHFKNPKVGVVQTKWEHINQGYSLLTELQAFQLNVHFTIEQFGRKAGNLMLQFNGTGGVWRKTCIEESGGWEADTLTEDLDLSYRAQLKGWEIVFLEGVLAPAELPAEINGLKSQQFRWMKGGAETARKMLPTVWRSDLNLTQKIHATSHLLASSVFLSVFIVGVFSVPLIFILNPLGIQNEIFPFFLSGLLSIIFVYYAANVQHTWTEESKVKKITKFVLLFPIFLALSMGLSLHNSLAVLQGYIGKQTPFIRTPKFGIKTISDSLNNKSYLTKKLPFTTILEGILALYFIAAIGLGIYTQHWTFLLLHILLAVGYSTIFYLSVKHLNYAE